ncbi:MAG: TM2 domain-containing protein [Ignavibacteriales bacterium]|nr:TM2 domain-containing protein [Ignavibacteriales bacterium]
MFLAGIHRFVLGNIGLGILYVLTGGLCLIGTIVDLVNYKKLTFEYNQKVAQEVMMMMRSFN